MLGIIITGTGVLMGFAAILFFFKKGHDLELVISFILALVMSVIFAVKVND